MLKIAIYGKGGIGKSTTVSNLSVTFRHMGYRVMQIGCDPKADSTCNLHGGKRVPTVLDSLRENEDVELERIVTEGVEGVLCVEAGGPLPGIGCAGRGIITAFEKLDELNAYEVYQPDIVSLRRAGRCGMWRVCYAHSKWICRPCGHRYLRRDDGAVRSIQHRACSTKSWQKPEGCLERIDSQRTQRGK